MTSQTPADAVFFALADPTRRRIVEMLAEGEELRVTDLTEGLAVTRQAVAKHLAVLRDAGLASTRRQGRERLTRLRPRAFAPLRDWLEHYDRFWDEKLDALKAAVEGRKKP